MAERRLTRRGLLLGAGVTPLWAASPIRLVKHAGEKVSFLSGDRLLFEYRYSAARPKTYVHPFCAPDGSPLTVDGPPDHVHHRGLMIAWSAVNGFDFWGEVNPVPHGRIVHQRFEEIRHTAPVGITSIEHWIAGGKVLLVERRSIRAPKVSSEAVWLEWESEFKPHREAVLMATGKHVYDGLGVRFIPSMDGGGVLNSNGTSAIKEANGEQARWCAYHGRLSGSQQAGLVIFDHRDNPRYPTPFFVMNKPFGYLSAAPTFRAPFPLLKPGDSLRLRYAVLSYLGVPQPGWINKMYGEWSATWAKS